jgi:hypothetical protein
MLKNQLSLLLRQATALIDTVWSRYGRSLSLMVIGFFGFAFAGVFVCPWFASVPYAISNSYEVGFNNLIAQISFPCAVMAFALCLALYAPRIFASRGRLHSIRLAGMPLSSGDLLAIGGVLFLQYGFIFFLWWLPTSYIADGSYFVNKAEAWFQGSQPYWDTEYAHGIIFLAPVVFLGRFLHCGIGDIRTIYYLYLAIWATLSMLALHWLLRRLSLTRGERLLLFLILGIFFIAESGGINAYPLRHLWPFLSLFILGARAAVVKRGLYGELSLTGIATLLLSFALLIGPEIFLVTACTIPAFFFTRMLLSGRSDGLVGGICTALLGAVLLLLSRSVFAGTAAQVSGDLNLPVYPSPLMLLYLFCCSTVLAGILRSCCVGRMLHARVILQSRNLALGLGVIAMSIGALSRADTGHIVEYGLFALVAAPAFLHGKARKSLLIWLVFLVLAAKVLMLGVIYAPPLFRAVLVSPHIPDDQFTRIETFSSLNHYVPDKVRHWIARAAVTRGEKNLLDGLLPEGFHEKILVPKALNDSTEIALRNRGLYKHPYMWSSMDAMFQKNEYYQHLLKETESSRWILLPEGMLWPDKEASIASQNERAQSERLSLLAICMFPPAQKKHPIHLAYLEEYRSYIFHHFTIVSQANGVVVMIHA